MISNCKVGNEYIASRNINDRLTYKYNESLTESLSTLTPANATKNKNYITPYGEIIFCESPSSQMSDLNSSWNNISSCYSSSLKPYICPVRGESINSRILFSSNMTKRNNDCSITSDKISQNNSVKHDNLFKTQNEQLQEYIPTNILLESDTDNNQSKQLKNIQLDKKKEYASTQDEISDTTINKSKYREINNRSSDIANSKLKNYEIISNFDNIKKKFNNFCEKDMNITRSMDNINYLKSSNIRDTKSQSILPSDQLYLGTTLSSRGSWQNIDFPCNSLRSTFNSSINSSGFIALQDDFSSLVIGNNITSLDVKEGDSLPYKINDEPIPISCLLRNSYSCIDLRQPLENRDSTVSNVTLPGIQKSMSDHLFSQKISSTINNNLKSQNNLNIAQQMYHSQNYYNFPETKNSYNYSQSSQQLARDDILSNKYSYNNDKPILNEILNQSIKNSNIATSRVTDLSHTKYRNIIANKIFNQSLPEHNFKKYSKDNIKVPSNQYLQNKNENQSDNIYEKQQKIYNNLSKTKIVKKYSNIYVNNKNNSTIQVKSERNQSKTSAQRDIDLRYSQDSQSLINMPVSKRLDVDTSLLPNKNQSFCSTVLVKNINTDTHLKPRRSLIVRLPSVLFAHKNVINQNKILKYPCTPDKDITLFSENENDDNSSDSEVYRQQGSNYINGLSKTIVLDNHSIPSESNILEGNMDMQAKVDLREYSIAKNVLQQSTNSKKEAKHEVSFIEKLKSSHENLTKLVKSSLSNLNIPRYAYPSKESTYTTARSEPDSDELTNNREFLSNKPMKLSNPNINDSNKSTLKENQLCYMNSTIKCSNISSDFLPNDTLIGSLDTTLKGKDIEKVINISNSQIRCDLRSELDETLKVPISNIQI